MRDHGARRPRPRFSLAAGITAVAAAVTVTGPPAAGPPASGSAAAAAASPALPSSAPASPVQVTVRPGAIRLPGTPARGPATTAECEKTHGIACFGPGQLRAAYHLPALYARGITGKGVTIMIVDSFGSPTIRADLARFDRQFGYPAPPKFTVIAPAGKIPPFDPGNADMAGWAGETTLDVEYAHALAPGANILLVETLVSETEGVAGFPQIVRAGKYALAHNKVGVISQSFSATEETFKDYAQLGPLRGASAFFGRPSYQNGVQAVTGAHRGVPDIAMSAACDGSVSVYSSYQPGQAGWSLTCGTSEATPEFAAIVALAGQVAGHPLGLVNPALYRLAARHAPGSRT